MIAKILEKAKGERDTLLQEVAKLDAMVVGLERQRAGLLVVKTDSHRGEIIRIENKLQKLKHVLNSWNHSRECLDFMIDYVEKAENELNKGVYKHG